MPERRIQSYTSHQWYGYNFPRSLHPSENHRWHRSLIQCFVGSLKQSGKCISLTLRNIQYSKSPNWKVRDLTMKHQFSAHISQRRKVCCTGPCVVHRRRTVRYNKAVVALKSVLPHERARIRGLTVRTVLYSESSQLIPERIIDSMICELSRHDKMQEEKWKDGEEFHSTNIDDGCGKVALVLTIDRIALAYGSNHGNYTARLVMILDHKISEVILLIKCNNIRSQ